MARNISTLLPLLHIPRCPEPLVLQALRNACRRFCVETEIWSEPLTTIASVADQAAYALTIPHMDVYVKRVRFLKYDTKDLYESLWSFNVDSNVLTFEYAPVESGKDIECEVVYIPETIHTEVKDSLIQRWGYCIAEGAACELKKTPGSGNDPYTWFDPNGAQVAERNFMKGVSDAKLEVYAMNQSGNKTIEVPYF